MYPNVNSLNNQNSHNPEPDMKQRIVEIWQRVPFFIRIFTITTIIVFIANLIIPTYMAYLSNIPLKTILSLQLWRLFTTVFLTRSILNIIFAFFAWLPDAIRLEQTSGTVRYILNFFLNNLLIQLIYSFLSLLLVPFGYESESNGLWPLILSEITLLCLANPDSETMLFYIPYSFRAKYYPWIILILFTLLNGIQLDLIAGVAYGHLFFYFLRRKLQFSTNLLMKAENSILFRCCVGVGGFVPLQVSNANASFDVQGGIDVIPPSFQEKFKGKGTVTGQSA